MSLLFAISTSAQTQSVNATIDTSKTGPPISKYIYGQFLEHAGNLVNEGIWAEMLADRKFYYPISSKLPEEPPAPAWRRRGPSRHWSPIGADEFVTMDSDKPYTGDHSPLVKLDKTEPHGFMQSGLAVRNGKAYTGRIILAGSPTAEVKVTLVWGKEPGDRQTITIPTLGSTYRRFPLRFVAKAESDDARLEIVGTGAGAFHVGAVSLMPADNIEGFRREVVDALKQLHSGIYRFPGGNFVPDYLSSADWSGHMRAHCLDYIDMLSEHFYSSSNMHTDLKLEKKVDVGPQPLIEWERAPATQVRVKYEHDQEYLKLIPALKAKQVPIAIDEWAYMDRDSPLGSYKTAPAYAWAFHEMFRDSDLFQMGAFTFATAMINEDRTRAVLSPTGLLFQMYREHFGSIPVEVSGNSPQPKPIYPAGGDQPAVNPGSDTYPLDVSAALSEDRKTLTFAVLNPSGSEQQLKLTINGAKLGRQGHLWRMAPDKLTAVNIVGQCPKWK